MVKQRRKPYNHAPQKKQQKPSKSQCHRCGDTSHSKQKCPAVETKCSICHKKGHWAKVCHNARAHEIRDSPNDDEFLGSVVSEPVNSMINNITGDAGKPWFVDIQVSGCPVQFMIDCGADVTLLPLSEFKKIASQVPLQTPDKKLTGVGEYKMKVRGQFEAKLKWEDRQTKQKVFVVENSEVHVPLLGGPAIEALSLVVKDARLDAVSSGEKSDYKKSYPKLFTGIGNTKQEYNIELKPNAKPFALSTPRRIALPLMEQIKEELTRMENLGVISPISQPTKWCAGMVVLAKSNNKVRICVDLTKLNENIRQENHPLPSFDETLGQLAGAKFFTKLDANSGFYQVPFTQHSAHLTTFITPFGRYCFNRLPFGISSVPEVFQRQMKEFKGCHARWMTS